MLKWFRSLSRVWRCLFYVVSAFLLFVIAGFVAIRLWTAPRPLQRGPYLQSVTPDSVWIVWETSEPAMGQIEYGSTPELGQTIQETQAVIHHEVQLTGLKPYSVYFYRLDTGKVKSKLASFRTAAPAGQSDYRFVVFGDTREGYFAHRAIVNRILDVTPDFVIHTGDMVEVGYCVSCWDEFFRIEAPLLRSAPFYPTLGNHEDDQSTFTQTHYFDIFHLPGIERWYAFDYGNAHFISLKADGYPRFDYFPDDEQLEWLEDQLATNDKPWTFVFFHVGVFTSRHEDFLETGMRRKLVPLFERYGVEAVFMGHNHGYERVEVNGITYLTTAGGGASLYDFTVPEPGSQVAARAFHFVLLEMDGDRLAGQVIDRGGDIIDQFELTPGE